MTSTRTQHPPRWGARLAGITLAVLGCTPATFSPHSLPDGAVAYTAPAEYRSWWASTEACSGLTGDFDGIDWYTVPGANTMDTSIGEKVGLWLSGDGQSSITIAGDYLEHELVIRHEMLHALLGRDGHPNEYFVARCGLTWESWQVAAGE